VAKAIVLEGFDGAGKSTLAKSLSDWLDRPVHTIGGPPANNFMAEVNCFQQWMKLNRSIIMDRCTPISRLCYEDHLPNWHVRSLHRWLNSFKSKALVIYCRPREFMHEPSLHDTPEHLERIHRDGRHIIRKYDALMDNVPHIKFDRFEQSEYYLRRGIMACL